MTPSTRLPRSRARRPRDLQARLRLELLEDRTLLSVALPNRSDGQGATSHVSGQPTPNVPDFARGTSATAQSVIQAMVADGLAQPMTWQNQQVYVKSGEWLARFADVSGSPKAQVQAVEAKLAAAGASFRVAQHLGDGLVLLSTPANLGHQQLQRTLAAVPGFRYVEPNVLQTNTLNLFPDDPDFDTLYGLHNTGQSIPFLGTGIPDADIDAPEAWDFTTGSHRVIAAVIDTGTDYTHQDLYRNIWINQAEIPAAIRSNLTDLDADGLITFFDLNNPVNIGAGKITDLNGNGVIDGGDLLDNASGWEDGADQDGAGFVDDLVGWDFFNNDNDPIDDNAHGTHTAGTLGAIGNNATGVTGVNWDVQIMPVKWIGGGGGGSTAGAVAAVNYVAALRNHGVDVKESSNSWHIFENSAALRDAIIANGDAGVLFVVAAGNDGSNRDLVPDWPVSFDLPNMITVAATDNDDLKADFSAWGLNTVDLGAPGVSTLSTTPGNNYDFFDGTSMATPHVAGVAALAWSLAPNATFQQIKEAILAGVDPIFALRTDGPTPVATGGRLNALRTLQQLGLLVSSSTPADGSVVATTPTQYVLTFTDPVDPATVQAGDLHVNGMAADTVALSNGDRTATFTFVVDPVTAQGQQTMTVDEGAIERVSDHDGIRAFTAHFRYDVLALQVTSTDPADGAVVTLPLTSITVNLNEPYAAASVDTSDLALSLGTVVGFTLVDADTIRYDVTGINQEGTLTFTLLAGALTDQFSNPNPLDHSASVTLDFGTVPFPTPTTSPSVGGSLIYQTSTDGFIIPAGDEDSFTILVDPGQTLTVILDPADDFQAAVSLFATDGGDVLVGSAVSAAAGEDAVIQPVAVPGSLVGPGTARSYKVTVAGVGGSTGTYHVRLLLDAAAELEDHDGDSNDSLATAQSLENSFVTLSADPSGAQRGAVVGGVRGGVAAGETYVGVRNFSFFGGSVQRYDTAGNLVQTITHPVLETGVISDVELGPDNVVYVALSTNFGGGVAAGVLAKFDLAGNYLGNVPLPDDSDIGFLFPFGFDVAPDGSVWVPQLNSGNVVHVAADGTLLGSFFVGGVVNDAAVRGDGQVFLTRSGEILQLDPGTGIVTFFAFDPNFNAVDLTFTPSGDLWVGDFFAPIKFDPAGNPIQSFSNFGTVDIQVDPSNNLWVANFDAAQIQRFDPSGNFLFSQSTTGGRPLGVAVLGIDSADELPEVDLADYYSVTLAAGESATFALDLVGGNPALLELLDSAGNTIAVGSDGGSVDQAISDFYATAGGTYYVKVSGNGSQYGLVVTRSAGFDVGGNGSFATARDIIASPTGGKQYILGHGSATSSVVLNAVDSGWYDAFGFHDPFNMNYVSGNIAGTGELRDFFVFDASSLSGNIAFAQFRAYNPGVGAGDFGDGYVSGDPSEEYALFDVTTSIDDLLGGGSGLVGTFNDLGGGIAYGSRTVSAADNGTLVTIDLGPEALADLSAKLGGRLALGGALTTLAGNSGDQVLFAFTFNDLNYPRQLVLGLDGSDYYRITLDAGATVEIETATPAGGPGEFVNVFDAALTLYDANGTPVAFDDNGADGRNALLSYTASASGTYYIKVASSPDNASEGEYVLSVGGNDTALPPFGVATTDPIDGAILRVPPATMTVDFDDTILVSSLQASDLKIDGIDATGVTIVDGNTVIFDLPGPLAEGTHAVTIAAGAITDVQGTPISAYTGTFFIDSTGPRVTATSVAPDGIVAPGAVTYTVTFAEPMNVANLSADDVLLFGQFRGTFFAPASLSFDGSGTVLTLTYDNLPDDNYFLVLVAGPTGGSNFTDVVGNALDGEFFGAFPSGDGTPGGDFVISFIADAVTEAYPTPLESMAPKGSQIYDPVANRVINFAGDADSFTITLDPGQKMTVLADPVAELALTLEVRDAANNLVGSTTAGAGVNALLNNLNTLAGGTYTITVGESSGATGLYDLQVTLNAALEEEGTLPGADNNTIATAQNIDSTFVGASTTLTSAGRGAVLGKSDLPLGGGFADEDEPNQPGGVDLAGFAQDVDGAGWNLDDNEIVTDATTVPHVSIEGSGDGTFDYYAFTVGAAGTRGIFDIDLENFDTELFLYDTNGVLLAESDDDGDDPGSGSGLASFIDFTFDAPGTYVIGVGAFNSFDDGGQIGGDVPLPGDVYTLHVSIGGHDLDEGGDDSVAEVEPNHPVETLFAQDVDGAGWNLDDNEIVTDATTVPHVSIEGSGDGTFDYYAFTVGAAGTRGIFDIDLENFDTELFLYDAAGNLLAANDDSFGDPGDGSGLPSFIDFIFPAAGTYYIGVGAFDSFDNGDGTIGGAVPLPGDVYTLHVSIGGHDLDEGDDPVAEVEPNHPLPPDLAGSAQSLDTEFFGLFADSFINNSTTIPHLSIAGTGDGTFDYYAFTVGAAGTRAIFDIDFENFDTELFLYDTNGNLLAQNDDFGGDPGDTTSLASFIDFTFDAPGTYVIGVGAFNSFDANGQIGGAVPLPGDVYTLHVSLQGAPVQAGEPDYYSVTLQAGQATTIALTGLTEGDVDLELRDGADNVLATGVSGASNVDEVINFTPSVTGTYYIRVVGGGAIDYSVVVTRNAVFDTESNDSLAEAQPVGAAQGVFGHVGGAGNLTVTVDFTDTGWYDVTGFHDSFNTNYVVGNISGVGEFRNFFVFDLSGVSLPITGATLEVFNPLFVSGDPSETFTLFDVSTAIGDLVGGGGGRTDIFADLGTGASLGSRNVSNADNGQIVSVPLNAAGLAALNAGLGGLVGLGGALTTLSGDGDQVLFGFSGNPFDVRRLVLTLGLPEDWYSVTLTGNQTVLDLETRTPGDGTGEFVNTLDPKIELYAANGTLVASGTEGADGRNERLRATGLANGTYYVRVISESDTQGEYYLGVKSLVTPTPTALVDNTSFGFTTRGPWSLVSGGYGGSYRRIAGNGDGSLYAQWQYAASFTAGTSYGLYVTWVASPTNATNARYKIFDGTTLIGTVTLDQTRTPNTALVNGALWQGLYVYTAPTSGLHVLRVQLDNSGNGTVVADAFFDPPIGGETGTTLIGSPGTLPPLAPMAFTRGLKSLSDAVAAPRSDLGWALLPSRAAQAGGSVTSGRSAKEDDDLVLSPTAYLDAAFALLGDENARLESPRARRGSLAARFDVNASIAEEYAETTDGTVAVAEEEPHRA